MEDDFKSTTFNSYTEGPGMYAQKDNKMRYTLFVDHLPIQLKEIGLRNLFKKAGQVDDVKIIPQADLKRETTFGFVRFKSMKEAFAAIQMFDGFDFGNKVNLAVKFSNKEFSNKEIKSRPTQQQSGPFAHSTIDNESHLTNGLPSNINNNNSNESSPDEEGGAIVDDPSCTKCGIPCKKKCKNCKAPYCSINCQRSDWDKHRPNCFFYGVHASNSRVGIPVRSLPACNGSFNSGSSSSLDEIPTNNTISSSPAALSPTKPTVLSVTARYNYTFFMSAFNGVDDSDIYDFSGTFPSSFLALPLCVATSIRFSFMPLFRNMKVAVETLLKFEKDELPVCKKIHPSSLEREKVYGYDYNGVFTRVEINEKSLALSYDSGLSLGPADKSKLFILPEDISSIPSLRYRGAMDGMQPENHPQGKEYMINALFKKLIRVEDVKVVRNVYLAQFYSQDKSVHFNQLMISKGFAVKHTNRSSAGGHNKTRKLNDKCSEVNAEVVNGVSNYGGGSKGGSNGGTSNGDTSNGGGSVKASIVKDTIPQHEMKSLEVKHIPAVTGSEALMVESTTPQVMELISPWSPPGNEKTFKIYCTCVVSPSCIWAQVFHDNTNDLYSLMQDMNQLYLSIDVSGYLPVVGEICVAKYSDGLYYRAEVLSFNDKSSIEVRFLDYGNIEVVSNSEIRQIRSDFLSLPKQAVLFGLGKLIPVDSMWSSAACKLVKELLLEKMIDITILYKSDDDDCYIIEATDLSGVSVSQQLIDAKVAYKMKGMNVGTKEPIKIGRGSAFHHSITPPTSSLPLHQCDMSGSPNKSLKQKTSPVKPSQFADIDIDNQTISPASRPSAVRNISCSKSFNTAVSPDKSFKQNNSAFPVKPTRFADNSQFDSFTSRLSPTKNTSRGKSFNTMVSPDKSLKGNVAVSPMKSPSQFNTSHTSSPTNTDRPVHLTHCTLPDDKCVDGIVTNVTSPFSFFIMLADNVHHLKQITCDINHSQHYPLNNPSIGMPCIIRSSTDDAYYRAVITAQLSSDEFTALCVDYGYSDTVNVKDLYELNRLHCELPCQTIHCSLHGLSDDADVRFGERFVSLTCGELFQVKKVYTYENKSFVHLYSDGKSILDQLATVNTQREPVVPANASVAIASISSLIPIDVSICQLDDAYVPVQITHIVNPHEFYFQLGIEPYITHITTVCSFPSDDLKPLKSILKVDNICMALFSEDRMWYRAKVIELNVTSGTYDLQFIDYGNYESVLIDNVRAYPNELLDVPILAVRCSLDDVSPPNGDASWSKMCIEHMQGEYMDKILYAKKSESSGINFYDSRNANVIDDLISNSYAVSSSCPITDITPLSLTSSSPTTNIIMASSSNVIMADSLPSVSIPLDDQMEVLLFHVESPNEIYINLAADNLPVIVELTSAVESCSTSAVPLSSVPVVGQLCLVASDVHGLYRAQVMSYDANDNTCLVYSIDYGSNEVVSVYSLREISSNLMIYPKQAIRCALIGIDNNLPPGAVKFINDQLSCDGCMECLVYSRVHRLLVDFYVESSSLRNLLAQYKFLPPFDPINYSTSPLPVIPADNMQHQVVISHAESSQSFWVQKKNEDQLMLQMFIQLQNHCNSSEVMTEAYLGQLVGAKFEDGLWYRSRIVELHENDSSLVYFLDYGNNQKTSLSDMCLLSSEIASFPPQGIHCTLGDDSLTTEHFKTLYEDKILLCTFKGLTEALVNLVALAEPEN
jgi:RNA recognition motif-containing protein